MKKKKGNLETEDYIKYNIQELHFAILEGREPELIIPEGGDPLGYLDIDEDYGFNIDDGDIEEVRLFYESRT